MRLWNADCGLRIVKGEIAGLALEIRIPQSAIRNELSPIRNPQSPIRIH